jgi:hypothetical protein
MLDLLFMVGAAGFFAFALAFAAFCAWLGGES